MKAIHNQSVLLTFTNMMFINKSKIQFESHSQLLEGAISFQLGCLSISQRYNLKAIHNMEYNINADIKDVYQ